MQNLILNQIGLSQSTPSWNLAFRFLLENSYFTSFHPPITSKQGSTQCRICFETKVDSLSTLLSQSTLNWNLAFRFMLENSYFISPHPSITSGQGLIWWEIEFYKFTIRTHMGFGSRVQIAFWVRVWVQIAGPYNCCLPELSELNQWEFGWVTL